MANRNYIAAGDHAVDLSVVPGSQVEAWDEEGFSVPPFILQVWQALIRWRWVVAGIIAACLVAGLIVTLLISPLFTARTQIEISREQKNITSVEGLDVDQTGQNMEFYATQYALLKADSLAERVVRKLKLATNPEFFEAHGAELADVGQVSSSADRKAIKERELQAVSLLLRNLSVEPVRNSRLIDIKYTSRSPKLSARIANTWVHEFIGSTMDRQFASSADARRFLEQRLDQLRQKLEESEREAVSYASSRDIITLDSSRDAEGRTMTQRTLASADLEALNAALAQAKAERVAAESRARSGSAESSPEVLTNPTINSLRAKRADLASQYAALMVRFEPGFPEARAIKQQLDALDVAIGREVSCRPKPQQSLY